MSLLKYALRRIVVMIPVLFGVLTLTFILSRLMPGDPVAARLAAAGQHNAAEGIYQQMKCQLGLCDPIIVQYFRYLGELFTGQWGVSVSIVRNQPVWDIVMSRMPLTIDLTLFSIIIASYVGTKAGVLSAVHRNKTPDTIVRGLALVGVALPVFFLGMILQYFLGYELGWFEPTGYLKAEYEDPPFVTGFILIDSILSGRWFLIGDYLWHMILPVFCLSFIMLASITRQTRSSMLEVLEQDFVRTARAKGCKEKSVIHTHALRNALIPTVTVIGMSIAGLLGGAVLTETTFGLTGMGKLFVDAILLYDFWVLDAIVFMITIIFITANLLTDLIYAILDPRIRYT
ncbi:MAG: ABC transporter permease [Promethearchaeota archaeon]|jgi:ABC-type dipeptide/oligopeptide/nickel transport system permease component